MAVYYYLSPKAAQPTLDAVLAYTHDDVFKPLPGFKGKKWVRFSVWDSVGNGAWVQPTNLK
jgi:hypothetical protein